MHTSARPTVKMMAKIGVGMRDAWGVFMAKRITVTCVAPAIRSAKRVSTYTLMNIFFRYSSQTGRKQSAM